jgi:hypothetical protein
MIIRAALRRLRRLSPIAALAAALISGILAAKRHNEVMCTLDELSGRGPRAVCLDR